MFGKRSLFKVPKHQKFDYKPMYYDPKKEELEDRLQSLKDLKDNSLEGTKARISSGMRSSHLADETYRKRQLMRSNLILVIVIVMLIVLAYLLLNVYLPEIEEFVK